MHLTLECKYLLFSALNELSTQDRKIDSATFYCNNFSHNFVESCVAGYIHVDFFRSRTNRITTKFKLVSNISVTIQWPSSVQYRQYNCMRINTAGKKWWE